MSYYSQLSETSLKGEALSREDAKRVLSDASLDLLPLLQAAYEVRKTYWQNRVTVHIINNVQNGSCPEDCSYCAQSKNSEAPIDNYRMKPDEEILAEAERAYKNGAFRYCMVSSGRGPNKKRVEKIANLVREIKSRYPIEVCVSAGLLDAEGAEALKAAGLDRLNHNLNTSERIYPSVCTTHTFQDRLNTLKAASKAGIGLCSGMIVGMGETADDILDVAYKLRDLNTISIPINFLIPIEGNVLQDTAQLSPQYCLRILALFRLLNPKSEIRAAAGREGHLRSLEVLSLYAASSIFLDGYLNTKGNNTRKTLQMIKDAGFTIVSDDYPLEDLLKMAESTDTEFTLDANQETIMKGLKELRPVL